VHIINKTKYHLFGSVIAVAFQSAFRAEMHQNDFFLFFKNHCLDQRIKMIQNIPKKLIFRKKKRILGEHGLHRDPKRSQINHHK